MRIIKALSISLVFLTLLLSGCGLLRERDEPQVDLTEIFPQELPAIGQAHRRDVDGDRSKEWLVFFHIDLVANDLEGSPTAAAVYRSVRQTDARMPPLLVPALLWLPNQGYVCLYTCEGDMEEAISGNPQVKELVIRDKNGEDTVGVAIFRWEENLITGSESGQGLEGGFVPLGHFRGDAITVEEDRVTVIRKHRDRSDLAAKEIYEPDLGHYYRQTVRHVDDPQGELRSPKEAEIIFAPGPPEKPAEAKLPEKLVLALYQNYANRSEIEKYFTQPTWERFGRRCPEDLCGCASRYEDVSRVMVKQIAYEGDLKKNTRVVTQVVCVNRNNRRDPIKTVTWELQQQEEKTWLLFNVTPGGDAFLCPPEGCLPLVNWE